MKKLLVFCMLSMIICGCAGSNKQESGGTVEEIKPGEKTVIQAPQPGNRTPAPGIEERTI